MEMLIMGACLSLFGLAVACLTFGAATHNSEIAIAEPVEVRKEKEAPSHFFAPQPALPLALRTGIPVEALMFQLETHVRLEQAAVECFLEAPSASLLHSRTTSPLVN